MTMLSTSDAADKLKCSNQFIRNIINKHDLKAIQIGRTWGIEEQDLSDWVQRTGYVIEPDDHPRLSSSIPDKVALSFFTGAGGLDIGMAQAGIVPILVSDIDKNARKSIAKNYPNAGLAGDITKLNRENVYKFANIPDNIQVDYMFGGPPCQAFSTAGKRRGYSDIRGDVFIKYLELIGQIKPRYAIIENVRGLLSIPAIFNMLDEKGLKGGVLLYAIRRLRSFGYTVSFNLYNAANFGAPETRERVIIIAKLGKEKVDYLRPTNSDVGTFGLPAWNVLGDAIKDIQEKHFVKYPKKRMKYLKYIPEGGNWRSMPVELQKEAMGKSYYLPGGKTGFLRRLSRQKPSPTLVTHPTMPATDLIHPTEDRPLSIEEYARIQGFPDNWNVEGKILEQYKQIGNAVPVPLGFAIGKRILADDFGMDYPSIPGFHYSRYKNTKDDIWEAHVLQMIDESDIYDLSDIPVRL
ncbi:DNA cytosine methyltransferase [Lactiplantibacillus plantarum]|uniref:DNA cytosine methyltransferase n=1 Tax=Lactiplantibacillus plantarum TaxID=1590 RepID=UPI0007ABF03F|nr:DNA cytosine methyltransferase [Lactiplantibacillus plantarum]KZD99395.1 DNA-cytosine methyltransferase [Lactiplantibacillus plantarum]